MSQGMGPESIYQLLHLPIEAIEFGALGGTNFTLIELLRNNIKERNAYEAFGKIGHTTKDTTEMINQVISNYTTYQ